LVNKDRIAYRTDGEAPATTTNEEGAGDTGDGDDGGDTDGDEPL
jgi:hypothetical protein